MQSAELHSLGRRSLPVMVIDTAATWPRRHRCVVCSNGGRGRLTTMFRARPNLASDACLGSLDTGKHEEVRPHRGAMRCWGIGLAINRYRRRDGKSSKAATAHRASTCVWSRGRRRGTRQLVRMHADCRASPFRRDVAPPSTASGARHRPLVAPRRGAAHRRFRSSLRHLLSDSQACAIASRARCQTIPGAASLPLAASSSPASSGRRARKGHAEVGCDRLARTPSLREAPNRLSQPSCGANASAANVAVSQFDPPTSRPSRTDRGTSE